MGATGWFYFVPYQEDVNRAMQDLRNDVFARKDYPPQITEEQGLAAMEQLAAMSPDPEQSRARLKALLDLAKRWEAVEEAHGMRSKKPTGEPKTIEELMEQRGESGTGTILDIDHVSDTPEFGALTPLAPELLRQFFGTEQPTRAMVEEWQERIPAIDEPRLYQRWRGIYFVVYKDGKPDETYFEGSSGD